MVKLRISKTFKVGQPQAETSIKVLNEIWPGSRAMAGLGLEFIKLLFKVRNKILRIILKLLSTFQKLLCRR